MENKDYYSDEVEINLFDLWRVIVKRKKLIIVIVLVAVLITAAASLLMTNIYQSKALITPVTVKETGSAGTMAMLSQQFGGLASLGISIPVAASASEIVNLLKSNVLREKIIAKYNLLPVLFADDFDEKTKKWKDEAGGPTIWDGLRALNDIAKVSHNLKENTIMVSVDFHDPAMARQIAEYFLVTLTDHMSAEAKRVALTNRKYLESQLSETSDPLIKQKIYNLIAQQIETSMMSEVKENFAFKVIDPPMTPDKKIKPKRTVMVVIAFIMALFVAILTAFFLEFIEKAKSKEKEEKADFSGSN